mgnify:CR=1 FL=1
MAAIIPDAVLGATYTNEITGVSYTYDGMKWVIDGVAGGPHEHEEYVKLSGDEMTGSLKITPDSGNSIGLEVQPGPDAFDSSSVIRVWDKLHKNMLFYVQDDGEIGTKDNYVPTSDRHVANKQYVDQAVASAGSLFRVVDVPTSAELEDGDVYFKPDAGVAYLSWKTLDGRIWPPNPTTQDWQTWPEGLEGGNLGHGRNIPESYMVWESVEDKHPYGMVTVSQITWKTYVDESGNIIGSTTQNTVSIKVKFTSSTSFSRYATLPPVGTIVRVRLAPFL